MSCLRVRGKSSAERRCSWRAPFPAVGSVLVDSVEHPGAQAQDFAQAPLHVPLPLRRPLVHRVGSTWILRRFAPLWAGVAGAELPKEPTQTSRQGDGGPLGPHVIER